MSRATARLLAILALLTLAIPIVGHTTVDAANPPRFLTLPFDHPERMRIQQGFYWTGAGHDKYHGGIDYIQGTLDRSRTWKSFPVYAAADGLACSQVETTQKGCIGGTGNRVLIEHTVDGKKYRTYYGHLRSISTRIPRGDKTVKVKRGELLGYAGYSGDPCCVIHLHFQLMDDHWKTVDPYGINGQRDKYPDPAGTNGIRNGRKSFWANDPPVPPSSFQDAPTKVIASPRPTRRPDRTPKPERTARPERTPRPTPTPRPERTARPTPSPTTPPEPSATPPPSMDPVVVGSVDRLVALARYLADWFSILVRGAAPGG